MKRADLSTLRAKLEPPWDDLRERRVLSAVLAERRKGGVPRRHAWVWAAAAAFTVLALVVWGARAWHRPVPAAVAAAAARPSTIALADGSTAVLAAEATMQIEEQRPDRVHLVQSKGSVQYEVRPDPSREFVVSAADTTIRVRGTAFTVDVRDGAVQVDVQRGRVEVTHAGTTRDLMVGESLRVLSGPSPLPPDSVPSTEPSDTVAPPEISSHPGDTPADRTAESNGSVDVPTAASLQAQADAARVAGDNGQAAAALERLVALHPRDPRVPGALFTLGRVERALGRVGASARAFERCVAAAPGGPLAQDALAESAQAWSNAGNDDAARLDATKYLRRWPQGAGADRMKAILEK